MTTCSTCGNIAGAADSFCGRCGSPLGGVGPAPARARFCTRCGGGLQPGVRFCGTCGADSQEADGAEVASAGASLPPDDQLATTLPPANGHADEEEDLLAEWETALRPTPAPHRMFEDPAITETIVRPAPSTRPEPVRIPPAEPFEPGGTAVMPIPPIPRTRPAPPDPPGRAPFRFPLGATLALLGAVAVILSAVLPWDGPFRSSLPRDIAAAKLLSPEAAGNGLSLGILLLSIGTLGALVALLTMAVPILKPLRRLVGLFSLSLPFLFAVQTGRPILAEGSITPLWSALGVGVYVAAGGAFIQTVAGRWFRR